MDSTSQPIFHVAFMIFSGTAVLATLALLTRQSLLVAYMVLGCLLGPWGLNLVKDPLAIKQAGYIGIIFLLFLLGLHLQPQNLLHSLRKMTWITLSSSVIFFVMGLSISRLFGFSLTESMVMGCAMMFSSTIIGLKLLPTTVLHHQHTGELMISILLLQDILAILILLLLQGIGDREFSFHHVGYIISAFPILLIFAFVFQHFVLRKLLTLFDKIHEYIFILSIGWCLFMAELGHALGLTAEIGAFIAGVALATSPISLYIAKSLKPLRDFFLVMFFFSIGASFNFSFFPIVILPALALALCMLAIKPYAFKWLLYRSGEAKFISWEIGVRLAQISEFSLLVIAEALQIRLISPQSNYTIQAAMILTFVVSCYWVVIRYPTPIATSDQLRRD